jgi:hypothetical protein
MERRPCNRGGGCFFTPDVPFTAEGAENAERKGKAESTTENKRGKRD